MREADLSAMHFLLYWSVDLDEIYCHTVKPSYGKNAIASSLGMRGKPSFKRR
ncbi:hypothetical protein [Alteromonas sp. A079]|uniref:hypothetical protein n=1 Tax=Alteromonas sp. A079 TaxID=3410268 RepID=UPI003BA3679A